MCINSRDQFSRRATPATWRIVIESLESWRLLSAVTWTGDGGDNSWTDPNNWSSDAVPTASDDATIPSGSMVQLGTGTFVVQGLTLQGNASLDLQEASLIVDYGSGTDPVATIFSYLAAGFGSLTASWSPSNSGILSSTVFDLNHSQSKLVYSVGYADGADGLTNVLSGDIEISPTLAGDVLLDGNVVFADFNLFSQFFTQSNTSWDQGDFLYNGVTNFSDFQLLAQNTGFTSAPLPAPPFANVPEPAGIGILLAVGAGLLYRRRSTEKSTALRRKMSADAAPSD